MSRGRVARAAAWWRAQDVLTDGMRRDIERHLRISGFIGKTHAEALLREIARLGALLDERLEEVQTHPCHACEFVFSAAGLWTIEHNDDGTHRVAPWGNAFTTHGTTVRLGPDRNDVAVDA